MPSGQILYLMMFVGKCSCTSHVLQDSSSSSYEHSRSPQRILCPGVVTVLICSFFVAALPFIYINLKNGGKIIHIFTNHQTFSYLFCIFTQYLPSFYLLSHVEKPREFDPRGQATMTPAGKNSLTLCGKIKMTPENDCFSGAFL